MKNVWKGMIVGASVGAGVGAVLDMANRVGGAVITVKDAVQGSGTEHVADAAARTRRWIRKTGVPQTQRVGRRVATIPRAIRVLDPVGSATSSIDEAVRKSSAAVRAMAETQGGER